MASARRQALASDLGQLRAHRRDGGARRRPRQLPCGHGAREGTDEARPARKDARAPPARRLYPLAQPGLPRALPLLRSPRVAGAHRRALHPVDKVLHRSLRIPQRQGPVPGGVRERPRSRGALRRPRQAPVRRGRVDLRLRRRRGGSLLTGRPQPAGRVRARRRELHRRRRVDRAERAGPGRSRRRRRGPRDGSAVARQALGRAEPLQERLRRARHGRQRRRMDDRVARRLDRVARRRGAGGVEGRLLGPGARALPPEHAVRTTRTTPISSRGFAAAPAPLRPRGSGADRRAAGAPPRARGW